MVEQPKYLEMTLSQLKAYVESSESNVLLVVEFPKEIRTMENELEVVNIRLVKNHLFIVSRHWTVHRLL